MTGHLRLLLLTLTLTTPAFAQPATGGGIAPTIDPTVAGTTTPAPAPSSGLILFGWDHKPKDYPRPTVTAQMVTQVRLLRSLLDVKQPNEHQSRLFRDLHESIFSVSRFVLNENVPRDSDLARALMPYVTEDMAAALKKRAGSYAEPSGPLGKLPIMYDTSRAIALLLRSQQGTWIGDRPTIVQFVRGLVGAIPYEGGLGCKDRQFLNNLLLQDLLQALYPQLPVSKGHEWNGYLIDRVDGDLGKAVNGLAGAWTLGGRKKNIQKVHAALDALEGP